MFVSMWHVEAANIKVFSVLQLQFGPQYLAVCGQFKLFNRVYSFEGLVIFSLLVVCTCAYMRRVPRLRQLFLSEKKGFFGVFYKASVIGTRLHIPVALTCVLMGLYILLLK
ncbi:hypothetical protein ACOMHN_010110 [Nucella lapillus]